MATMLAGMAVIGGACGSGQTASPSGQEGLFPEFELRGKADDWVVRRALRELFLSARLPEKVSEDEHRLAINPAVLPVAELRAILQEKWVPADTTVFVKKRGWLPKELGSKLEKQERDDALVVRSKVGGGAAVQLVYMVEAIALSARRDVPFVKSGSYATDEDISRCLASFLVTDLYAQVPGPFDKRYAESAVGQKITLVVLPAMRQGQVADETRSAAAGEALYGRLVISGQHVGLLLVKGHADPFGAGALVQPRTTPPLFVDPAANPKPGSDEGRVEDGEAVKTVLAQESAESVGELSQSLRNLLDRIPTNDEALAREYDEHSEIALARRKAVVNAYDSLCLILRKIEDCPADERAAIIERALEAQSNHPVARLMQSDLKRAALKAMQTIPREKAAEMAKKMIEVETRPGPLREEISLVYHGMSEADYAEYVRTKIEMLSARPGFGREELLKVWRECLPR